MRRALVIGAETGGLAGVLNDADTVTTLLAQRGFEVDRLTGQDATRAAIIDRYHRLVANTSESDSAAVYFSGHGGLARVLTPEGKPLPDLHFIVPADYDQSRPGDFRGITATELSYLLQQLTGRTRNAVVILDCCHAAHMSRNYDLRPRALAHPTYLDIAEHVGMLRAQGMPTDQLHPIGNPDAVRLVACAPWESAYEYTNGNGIPVGLATDSLRVALEEAGTARITWATLVQRIRNRVSTVAPAQRPDVEGPSRRILFDEDEARGGTRFSVVRVLPDRLSLPGAALLGVRPGDLLAVTPAGVEADESTMIARATVSHTDGVNVTATFELNDGQRDLPAVAEAHPLVTSQPQHKVLVCGDGPLATQMHAAVAAEHILRAADPDDPPDDEPVLAEIRVADQLSLWDGGTKPLVSMPADPAGVRRMVAQLARLARTAGLRRLTPDPDEELSDRFAVEWGRVVDGRPEPLNPSGTMLHVGESVYLRLRNDSDRDLYFFVFDLGVAGAVTLLTSSDPSGLRVSPGREYLVGDRDGGFGVLTGSSLVWPDGVPKADPRPETILILVTAARQDLAALAHGGVDLATRGASSLARALAAAGGATREWSVANGGRQQFAVARLEFQLNALPAPAREVPRFLIDERPDYSLRLLTPRSDPRPRKVAVRLPELVVHRNRALGGADVRVDTLVLTGGGGDIPAYQARTARFSNVHDDDRLPLDNLLVYHGLAVDYLDIAVWVSRDRRDSLSLNDLMRERLNADDVRSAIASVIALAVAAPQAALAAASVSACAVIVSTAYQLLSGVVGNTIGLYRTSLLAGEDFGVGRHPIAGTRLAQDFSFAYEVVAIG